MVDFAGEDLSQRHSIFIFVCYINCGLERVLTVGCAVNGLGSRGSVCCKQWACYSAAVFSTSFSVLLYRSTK